MGTKSSSASAINKDLVELHFIEKYHWLPNDIAKIPYRWIQKYFLIDRARTEGIATKQAVDKFKQEHTKPKRR